MERPLKQDDTDPPFKRYSMFSLRGWKYLDDDERRPLAEVTPNSWVTYNEEKAVYIFLRGLINMGCTVSSQSCSIPCWIVDGFSHIVRQEGGTFRGFHFYVFQFRFVRLFYLVIQSFYELSHTSMSQNHSFLSASNFMSTSFPSNFHTFHSVSFHKQVPASDKKNDRLYQRTTYNYIHWPHEMWKNSPCFRLD